jgi:2,3-dihydroxybenzoate decarboxylase
VNTLKNRSSKVNSRKITVEEHFSTQKHLDDLKAILDGSYPVSDVMAEEKYMASDAPFLPLLHTPHAREMIGHLLELGEGRLQVMDRTGIDMQVLSLVAPDVQVYDAEAGTKMARKTNDLLSRIVNEHPTRFAGLASLALQNPEKAADELERSVMELGLKGASISSHTKGEYPDQKQNWVVFERAQALGVPIYLHPRAPSSSMIKPYLDYPFMDSAMLGFAAEAGLSAMRLICSGLFDEYPELKIILGHLGEAIPFWLWRIDNFWKRGPLSDKYGKTPSQYFRDNFWVSTSGMFSEPVLQYTLSVLGADNILFAVDYPMEPPEVAVEFIENSSLDSEEKEKIFHTNAERVFSL